ncbi:MAG: hypothetical protein OEZ02_00925 [Anaerolineae bacterium]|nr:hypothetical protein [Anaerolineae bacterium]
MTESTPTVAPYNPYDPLDRQRFDMLLNSPWIKSGNQYYLRRNKRSAKCRGINRQGCGLRIPAGQGIDHYYLAFGTSMFLCPSCHSLQMEVLSQKPQIHQAEMRIEKWAKANSPIHHMITEYVGSAIFRSGIFGARVAEAIADALEQSVAGMRFEIVELIDRVAQEVIEGMGTSPELSQLHICETCYGNGCWECDEETNQQYFHDETITLYPLNT